MSEAPLALAAPADERLLIGSCVRWPNLVDQLRERVTASHFATPQARAAYRAVETVADRGELPLFTTVTAELARQPDLSLDLRSGAYLAECATEAVSDVWIEWHALNVLRAAGRRALLTAGRRVEWLAQDEELATDEALARAQEAVAAAGADARPVNESYTDAEMGTFAATYTTAEGGNAGELILPLGLADLDARLIGGARPGQLVVIGARTGLGKSAMLRQVAYSCARYGRVLYHSNEMTREQILQRDLAALTGIPLERIMRRAWQAGDRAKLTAAEARIGTSGIESNFDRPMTSAALARKARTLRDVRGLVAVVVDYLQNLNDPGDTDYQRVSVATRGLKNLALALNVPVIVGAQLNRGGEVSEDARPRLTDLRDSGEVEQSADVVLLLYRADARYRPAAKRGDNTAEVIVAKQRMGEAGRMVKVAWLPLTATFADLAREGDTF